MMWHHSARAIRCGLIRQEIFEIILSTSLAEILQRHDNAEMIYKTTAFTLQECGEVLFCTTAVSDAVSIIHIVLKHIFALS